MQDDDGPWHPELAVVRDEVKKTVIEIRLQIVEAKREAINRSATVL